MKSTLMIKDLAATKELDSRAMSAVVGGNKIILTDVSNSGNIVVGNGNQTLNNSTIVSDSFNDSFNGSFNSHSHYHGHYHGRSAYVKMF